MSEPNASLKPNRSGRLVSVIALAILALAVSLYAWTARNKGENAGLAQSAACSAATGVAGKLKPLAKGELAAFQVTEAPKPLRPLNFLSPEGKPLTLEAFKGKMVLLNLWATWCVPCRQEMPALDALNREFGGPDFEVVAVNIDTRNFERPKAFLTDIGVKNLAYYADPKATIFQDLKSVGRAFGMPTTLLIDKDGCELGHLAGPAEWASDDAKALVRAALGR